MNITTTPDVIEQLDETGSAWIVGEGSPCATPTSCPRFTRQMCPHGGIHPPADLVAAAEPCATCDGSGQDIQRGKSHGPDSKCSRGCHNGKPRLDLMVECLPFRPEGIWQCNGCHRTYPEYVNGCVDDHDSPRKVVLVVPGNGEVHAATVTAVGEVVPIHHDEWGADHDYMTPDGFMFGPKVIKHGPYALPANAKPGMYALQVEKVPE